MVKIYKYNRVEIKMAKLVNVIICGIRTLTTSYFVLRRCLRLTILMILKLTNTHHKRILHISWVILENLLIPLIFLITTKYTPYGNAFLFRNAYFPELPLYFFRSFIYLFFSTVYAQKIEVNWDFQGVRH